MSLARQYDEVKCPRCGWVHASVPPTVIDDESSSERGRYFRCFSCGHPSAEFVPAGPDDAPVGSTLQPVVIPQGSRSNVLVIALDLEGTLISSAVSQFPRPHLHEFLTGCQELTSRIVMFTTVGEARFRTIAELLVREGHAPAWYASVEYIAWSGPRKDLSFVPLAKIEEVLLVDDVELYVEPSQRSQWIPVQGFEPPGDDDVELLRVLQELRSRAANIQAGTPAALREAKAQQPPLLDSPENLIRQRHLVSLEEFQSLMNWTSPQSVSRALAARRIFGMHVEGQPYFPAFFADAVYSRKHLAAVTQQLGHLPAGAKLQFFGSRKGSLNGKTPLEALVEGQLEMVLRLAAAYAES